MREGALLVAALVGALPGPAAAQVYVVTSSTAAYAPLNNPTVPALTGGADTGYATIPIGFTFPFYAGTYSSLTVTADGLAYLVPSPGTTSYPSNVAVPSPANPNGLLAPLWDNLEGSNASSQLGYELGTGANGHVLTVEWAHWNHWSATATYDLSFQLRLHENGLVEMHYGAFTGGGLALTATVGIEDALGASGVSGKSCSPSCAASNIAAGERLVFGPGANTIDLIARRLRVTSITESGGALTVSTELELSNFGSATASAFEYALYLSQDTALDASDPPMSPSTQGPLSLGPLARTTHAAQSTVAMPASGAWYVLAAVDPTNALAETLETNNVAVIASPLVAGVDLVAQSIASTTASAGPGDAVENVLTFANRGFTAAGPTAWRIWLSEDAALDPSADFAVRTGTVSLAGGQAVSFAESYALPATVPGGAYRFLLQLDDGPAAGQIAEVSDTNNVSASLGTIAVSQPDVAVSAPAVASAGRLYIGEPFSAEVAVTNASGAWARGVMVVLHLSTNETLNAVNDPEAGASAPLTLAPGASELVTIQAEVPTATPLGLPVSPGAWYLFSAALSTGQFADANPTNDVARAGPLLVAEPAPDLVGAAVFAPFELGAGEAAPVRRVIRNVGNRPSPPASYRLYLSKNEIVTAGDIPLLLLQADGGWGLDGPLPALAPGRSESATAFARVPAGTVPSDYVLGVIVDPADAVQEIDERNNGFAGQPVRVVGQGLALAKADPAPAVVGLPYLFEFVARGGVAPLRFEVAEGLSALPEGLTLDADTGRMSGTPTRAGVSAFVLRVTDAQGARVETRAVARVVLPTAGLEWLPVRLRQPVQGKDYEAFLSAQGGSAPYAWTVVSGELPAGLSLAADGRIWGIAVGESGERAEFGVVLSDASGSGVARSLALTVIAPGESTVDGEAAIEAVVGGEVVSDLVMRAPEGAPAVGPVRWDLRGGDGSGVSLAQDGSDVALLQGTAAAPGLFPLVVRATDADGREATAEVVLRIHPLRAVVTSDLPSRVKPGEALAGRIFVGGLPAASAHLASGHLPPGVQLSADGAISGRVADDAPPGVRAFSVVASNAEGAEGWGALAVEISRIPEPSPCGCSGSAGGLPPAAVLGFGFALRARRRWRA